MRHFHFVDGDQLSHANLKILLSQIATAENVLVTIVHNGNSPYRHDLVKACQRVTGATLLESPKVKNGADFYLISLLTETLIKQKEAQDTLFYLHTNDSALANFAKFTGLRFLTSIEVRKLVN